MPTHSNSRLTGISGYMVALLLGLATVATPVGASVVFGSNIDLKEEWSILLFQVLWVSAPFGALAAAGESGRVAWLTALALTAMFWGVLIGDALIRRGSGGANIGLGLLMILSPLIIAGGAFGAAALARRAR